jgi:hypothetical protein
VFKGLRLRLTATYIAAALGLVLLMGLGTYALLDFYFQSDNDAVLRYRVALEYESLGVQPPPELAAAKREWQSRHSDLEAAPVLPPGQARKADEVETSEPDEANEPAGAGGPPWKTYPDSELAPLFVFHLDSSGNLIAAHPYRRGLQSRDRRSRPAHGDPGRWCQGQGGHLSPAGGRCYK